MASSTALFFRLILVSGSTAFFLFCVPGCDDSAGVLSGGVAGAPNQANGGASPANQGGVTGSSAPSQGGSSNTETGQGGAASGGASASSLGGAATGGAMDGSGGSGRGGSTNVSTGGQVQGGAAAGGAAAGGRSSRSQGGAATRGGAATQGGAATSAGGASSAVATEYVDAHNAVRSAVTQPSNYSGTWTPIPNVTWSDTIAATAQAWAENLATNQNCGLVHATNTGYGENLAMGTNLTPQKAVDMWASEKNLYTYSPTYSTADFNAGSGHYTQLVWRKTTQIGCGSATCSNNRVVICCRYSPPGNYIGQAVY